MLHMCYFDVDVAMTRSCSRGHKTHSSSKWFLIHGTKFSLTKISLFERIKFQASLTKERLKLVMGLKLFSKENPY
jgi:hypothetical protein